MLKFDYDITPGQLMIFWIAIICWSAVVGTYADYDVEDGVAIFLWATLIISWLLILFYTLGWRRNRK